MKRDMPPREFRADNICYKLFMRPLDELIKPGTLVAPNFYPGHYRVRSVTRSQPGEYPADIVAYDLWVMAVNGDQAREIPLYGYVAVGATVVSVYSSNELAILTDDGFPRPNEHGVYSTNHAYVTEVTLQKHVLTINALQIGPSKFIAKLSYSYKMGAWSGPWTDDEIFPTLEIATDQTLAKALWFITGTALRNPDELLFARKLVSSQPSKRKGTPHEERRLACGWK